MDHTTESLSKRADPQLFSTHIKRTLEKPDIVAYRGMQIYCRKQIGQLIYEVGCRYQADRNRAKLNYATVLCGYVEKDGQRYYVGLCLKGDRTNVEFNAAMIGPRLDGRGCDER